MSFEKMFEGLGEQLDKGTVKFNQIVKNTSKKIVSALKDEAKKMEEDSKRIEERIQKKFNKGFSRKNLSDENLSNFETAVGNLAINVAHGMEVAFKKASTTLFCAEKELKTKYGKLGAIHGRYKIFRYEAEACLKYIKELEHKIPNNIKLKKAILKDAVETLSCNNTRLFGYYLYSCFLKKTVPSDVEKKKNTIKKYVLTPEEKEYYTFEEKGKRGEKNRKKVNEKHIGKYGKKNR